MDLDPTVTLRTRGRASEAVECDLERELSLADLALLDAPRASAPSPLKALRAGHHALAMALASGKRPGEAALVAGYSASRVSVLQSDPAFAELVEYYRANQELAYVGMHERLARVSHNALAVLEERLEDNPEGLTEDTLIDLAKLGADRTGHGPQSKNLHLHANAGDLAGRLQRGRERAAAARRQSGAPAPVIEGVALPAPSPRGDQ